MKIQNLAILVILFSATVPLARSQNKVNYHLIAISYVGPSDKPINSIIISDRKFAADSFRKRVLRKEAELTSIDVVGTSLMLALISDAKTYGGVIQRDGPNSRNPISITLVTPQNDITVLLDAKTGNSLLESFKKLCTDDINLYYYLSHFQSRVREWYPNEGLRN